VDRWFRSQTPILIHLSRRPRIKNAVLLALPDTPRALRCVHMARWRAEQTCSRDRHGKVVATIRSAGLTG